MRCSGLKADVPHRNRLSPPRPSTRPVAWPVIADRRDSAKAARSCPSTDRAFPAAHRAQLGHRPLAVLRPIEREPLTHQPVGEVHAASRAHRNAAAIPIAVNLDATGDAATDEIVECIRGLRAAATVRCVRIAAKLAALGRVDAPEPDARSVDFERVTVDDAGTANKIVSKGRACTDDRDEQQEPFQRTGTQLTLGDMNSNRSLQGFHNA